MNLFLVGAGHVGLVTAVGFARLGHRLTVADIDAERIAGLQAGRIPLFEPGLEEAILASAAQGRLVFTTDLDPPPESGVSIVTVSTPNEPDEPLSMANVEAAVGALLARAGLSHIIVVRSTLPVDGPARLLRLTAGLEHRPAIVTNPEFTREGSAIADFERPDRIVVGWLEPRDHEAAQAVLDLYKGLHAPTMVADARSVALVKLASNVFLAAKVAYANELARICDVVGADVDTVAAGIGMDGRIGRAFLTAGPGYGGSCLPEQAVALSRLAAARDVPTPLIDAVSRSNETHQRAIVRRLAALLADGSRARVAAESDRIDPPNGAPEPGPLPVRSPDGSPTGAESALRGRRVALLGLAFKAETDDVRGSPAMSLASYLREAGAHVVATDPRATEQARRADPALEIAGSVAEAVAEADAVLVATEWREFASLDWTDIATRLRGDLVYDTRNVIVGHEVRDAGLRYVALGRD